MALTAQQILDTAWIKVNEQTGGSAVRWPTAEALTWLNRAALEIVNQLPSSNAKHAQPVVASGSKQDFAGLAITDGLQWLDMICNIKADNTRGRPIRKLARAVLDDQLPDWHTTSGDAATQWMFDESDPKTFYLYPQPPAGRKVEVVYAAVPANMGALNSAWPLDDVYANAAEAFVLYSFYLKDATYTKNPQLASSYWQLFQGMLGIRGQNNQKAAVSADVKAQG